MRIIRRIALVTAAMLLCFAAVSCGGDEKIDSEITPTPEAVETLVPEDTAEPTAEPTEEPTPDSGLNIGVDEETGFGEFHDF